MSEDLYIKAEEILEEELMRPPTWEEIEDRVINLIAREADRLVDEAKDQ